MMSGSGDGPGEEPPPHPSKFEQQFKQQQTLITQMKDVLRQNEKQLSEKEKVAEEYANKLSSIKSRSRKSQLLSPKPDGSIDTLPSRKTPVKDLKSIEPEKLTPSKGLTLLRQKVNENRVIFEQRGREMTESKRGVQVMVEQLKAQLDDRDSTIRELQASPTVTHTRTSGVPGYDQHYVHQEFVEEASGLPVSKDYQIAELSNKVLALEAVIVGLNENLLEKDSVIDARTKAIALMSEDLCRKTKSTVDQLEETREEMRRMQNNFVAHETDMKHEKEELNRRLEAKSKRLVLQEEANNKLETIRSELISHISELQDKLNNSIAELPVPTNHMAQQEEIEVLRTSLFDANQLNVVLQEKVDNASWEQCAPIDNMALQEKIEELTALLFHADKEVIELQEKLSLSVPVDNGENQTEIEQLTMSLSAANNRVVELEVRLSQSAQIDNSEHQVKIDELTMALLDANNRVVELEGQLTQSAQIDNSEYQVKVDELTALLADANQKVSKLQEKLDDVPVVEHQRNVETLTASLADANRQINELRGKADSIPAHVDMAQQLEKIDQLTTSLSDANKQIIRLKAQTKKQVKQLNSLKKVSDANGEILELQNRIAELEEEKGNLQLHVVDFDELKVSESRSGELIVELESRLATLKAESEREAEMRVQKLEEALGRVEEMKIRAELRVIELEEDVDRVVKEKSNLADALQALQVERADTVSTKELSQTVDSIVQEAEQHADLTAQLNEKIDCIRSIENQLGIGLGTGNTSLESCVNEINSFRNKIQSLESRVDELCANLVLKDEQLQLREQELRKTESALQDKITEQVEKDDLIGKHTENLNVLQRDLEHRTTQLQESILVNSKQTEKMKKVVANLKARTFECKAYNDSINELKLLVQEKDSIIAQLNHSIEEQQRLVDSENMALQQVINNDELVKKDELIGKLSEDLNAMQRELERKNTQIEESVAVHSKQTEKMKKLVANLKARTLECKGYNDSMNEVKLSIQEKDSIIDQLQHDIDEKQRQLEKQEQSLRDSIVANESNMTSETDRRVALEKHLAAVELEFISFRENSDRQSLCAQETISRLNDENSHLALVRERAQALELRLQQNASSIEQEKSISAEWEAQLSALKHQFMAFKENSEKASLLAENKIALLKLEISELEVMIDTMQNTANIEDQLQQSNLSLAQEKSIRVKLEGTLSNLEQEFAAFSDSSAKELATAESWVAVLNQQTDDAIRGLQAKVQQKEMSIQKMITDINNMNKAHNNQLLDCNSKMTSLQCYIDDKEKEITEYSEQFARQRSMIEELQQRCESSQATLKSVGELEERLAEQSVQLLNAQEAAAENKRQSAQSLAASDAKLQEQQAVTESLDAELEKSKVRIERLEVSLEDGMDTRKMLEDKNDELVAQLQESATSRDLISQEKDVLEEKLHGIMSGSDQLRLELQSQQEVNVEYSQVIADLKSKIPELEKNLSNAQNRLKVIEAENERLVPLEQQLLQSHDEVDGLKMALNRSSVVVEQRYNALQNDLQSANSNLDAVCAQFDLCDEERRLYVEKCGRLQDERFGLLGDLEDSSLRLEDSLARIARLEMDVDEMNSKLNDSEKLSRTSQERRDSTENKLSSADAQLQQYCLEVEEKLSSYENEVEALKRALQEERRNHFLLQVQVESLKYDYECKLVILTEKNSNLKELICKTETLKLLCEEDVSNIISLSEQHVGVSGESGSHMNVDQKEVDGNKSEEKANPDQVSVDLCGSWNETADEEWAWGTEEAKLEEEHQNVNQQKESSPDNTDIPDLTNQLALLQIKVGGLEAEKEKLAAELKAAQVRNGKLLKKLKENKPKSVEPNSLDLAMEKEFTLQISSLEKEMLVLKAEKEATAKEKQQLKYHAEALEWQISELSEDKSKMSESIDWCERQIKEKENTIEESTSVIKALLDDVKVLTMFDPGHENQMERCRDNSRNPPESQEPDIVPQLAQSVHSTSLEHSVAMENASLKQELDGVSNFSRLLELELKESEEEVASLKIMLSTQSSDSSLVSLQSLFHETKIELDMYRQRYAELETMYNNACREIERLHSLETTSGHDTSSKHESEQLLSNHAQLQDSSHPLGFLHSSTLNNANETLLDLQNQNMKLEMANKEIKFQLESLQSSYNELKLAFEQTNGLNVLSDHDRTVAMSLNFAHLGEHELRNLCVTLSNENEQMRNLIQAHSGIDEERQREIMSLTDLLSQEQQKLSDLSESYLIREQDASNLKARLEIRNVEVEDMSKELKEQLNVIKLLKSVQDGHQRDDDGEAENEDGGELDLALYLLHQKEVRCDELTLELMQLLEERDTLQLRLSTALRSNEELRRPEASGRPSPPADSATIPVPSSPVSASQQPSVDTSSDAEVLADKLDQLRSVGRQQRQMALQQQRVGSAALDANYTLSRDAQSTSETLLNWIWGRSTPRVMNI